MRGKVKMIISLMILARITPACAGKSYFVVKSIQFNKDHPRVCGEKWDTDSPVRSIVGSPPRVRGKVKKKMVSR